MIFEKLHEVTKTAGIYKINVFFWHVTRPKGKNALQISEKIRGEKNVTLKISFLAKLSAFYKSKIVSAFIIPHIYLKISGQNLNTGSFLLG